MKHKLEQNTLTLFLEGQLNSSNSDDVEAEIEDLLEAAPAFDALRIDMEKLRYISSAGLRVLARLRQHYKDFALVKVPENICETLDLVGFRNVVDIYPL